MTGLRQIPRMFIDRTIEKTVEVLQKRHSYLSRSHNYYFPERGRVIYDLNKLLEVYKEEPMAQRAVDKKSKDLFEAGFELEGLEPEERLHDELTEFMNGRNIRLKWKLSRCARDAMVYGNGFLEVIYEDDTAKAEEQPNGSDIVGLASMSPLQTIIVENNTPDTEGYGEIKGFLSVSPEYIMGWDWHTYPYLAVPESYAKSMMLRGNTLHPDRVVHMKFNALSDSHVGISILEPAYNIMKSKIDSDKVFGTIITRYAKPILEATIEGGTPDEIKKAGKILSKINSDYENVSYLAHDQAWKTDIKGAQGQVLNPEPYMKYLTEQIAIGFGVPRSLLVGSEAGAIAGSSLNLITYFQSLESDQMTVLTPIIMRILNDFHFVRHGKELPKDITIAWNRLYSDEIAAAKSSFMGLQNIIKTYEAGLTPTIATRKKISDITGIEYSDKDEDYEKPKSPSIKVDGLPFGKDGKGGRDAGGGVGEKPPEDSEGGE